MKTNAFKKIVNAKVKQLAFNYILSQIQNVKKSILETNFSAKVTCVQTIY